MILSGRIMKGVGGRYYVGTADGVYECQARGLFRKQRLTPCVGDFAELQVVDGTKKIGYLHRILPRSNELFRPRVNNVDVCVIVFALAQPELSPQLLDRFIVLVEKQGLPIILCLNKFDLVGHAVPNELVRIYNALYPVVLCSADSGAGIDELTGLLSGKAAVLAGPSGVGKSSLTNALLSEERMETGEISRKIERGKHTTRHAEFLGSNFGGYIVDTPGFASVTTESVAPAELQSCFREFTPFSGQCRYRDCMHDSEPDCAVKNAVGTEVSELRYQSYLAMLHGNS